MTKQENFEKLLADHAAELRAKDAEIARLKERLDVASKRIAALTGTGVASVDRQIDAMKFRPGDGVNRMAAGMKLLPAAAPVKPTRSVVPATAAIDKRLTLPLAATAGQRRMAAGMRLPKS